MNKKNKITAIVVVLAMMFSLFAFAATLYPYALVSFTGINIVTNGSTTQGFIDITLKNINTTGISFCLKYDKSVMELSDLSSNSPITNPTSMDSITYFNVEHKYFEQDTDNFPASPNNVFRDSTIVSSVQTYMPTIIGVANPNSGHVIMNFIPIEGASDVCANIEDVETDGITRPTIMAEKKDMHLGRLSFCIKDPVSFSQMDQADLDKIIQVVPFSEMIDTSGMPTGDKDGVQLSYVDKDGDITWYSRADQNISYEFTIDADLVDVNLNNEQLTVSSYEIYKQGTNQDLLDFLNERMSDITLDYADGSQVPAKFEWTMEDSNINLLTWNSRGQSEAYEVTQKYNDKFNVKATVYVTPVRLIGFTAEKEHLTYDSTASDFPADVADLDLPKSVTPVFDKYIPNGGIGAIEVEEYQYGGITLVSLPSSFSNGGHFEFEAKFNEWKNKAYLTYPWMTFALIPDVIITRDVVSDAADLPKSLLVDIAQVDENGVLTIVIENSDGTKIPDGTAFTIKMPDGEIIDTDALATNSHYTVDYHENDASDLTVTITISPDISTDSEKKLAQLINLGDRAGKFQIASTEPGKTAGEYTSLSFEPRKNYYLETSYSFDYSLSSAAMFPVNVGTVLPKTVTLPFASDYISTTYDGYSGEETGKLHTFTVDQWNVSGDVNTAGNVITVTGTLLDGASYTNYGTVNNNKGTTVTVKYVVTGDSTELVDNIADFVYDMKQEGYDYDDLQTENFTLSNLSASSLHGLSIMISPDSTTGKEAFVLTKSISPMLMGNESATFAITTKHGLPKGKYRSTVTIQSNNQVLQTFNIDFEVSDKPVYKISVSIEDSQKDFGTAETSTQTYTAQQDDVVTLVATTEEDCRFTGWTSTTIGVEFADASKETTTFVMPGSDVDIKANFQETLGAKLRASELYVRDAEDANQTLYDDEWKATEYDPATREYYVVVPNTTDKVKLVFKPREEAKSAAFTMGISHLDVSDSSAVETEVSDLADPTKNVSDDYYTSDDVDITVSPTKSIIYLNITYDDPSDDPDEEEVKRTYKIHVYRKLNNSELMTFNPGNSPYGLIMKDDTITDKDAAKEAFIDNDYTFVAGNTPSGGTVGTRYSPKAWQNVNYDTDGSALFVISSEQFVDPGYSKVRNSIGMAAGEIKKEVTVKRLTENIISNQNGSSDDFVYVEDLTIPIPSSGLITELQDKRIRPDKYELVYSFTDFDGSTAKVSKTLIILSALGDINVNKTVDNDDAERVIQRFRTDIANNINVPNYEAGGLIFKYRVCDTNKSGNVNAVDGAFITEHYSVSDISPFYVNVSEGGGA